MFMIRLQICFKSHIDHDQLVLGKKTSTAGKGALVMHNKYDRHGDTFKMLFLDERRVNGRV